MHISIAKYFNVVLHLNCTSHLVDWRSARTSRHCLGIGRGDVSRVLLFREEVLAGLVEWLAGWTLLLLAPIAIQEQEALNNHNSNHRGDEGDPYYSRSSDDTRAGGGGHRARHANRALAEDRARSRAGEHEIETTLAE